MRGVLADNGPMPKQISIRVPNEALARGDRLAEALRERPEYQTLRITRSRALILAMMRGLDVMEAELGIVPRKRKRTK